jgi:pepF/M3 family oligoendopeptidase
VHDTSTLPHWDVTAIFPALSSREFAAAHEGLGASIDRLRALYDEHDIHAGPPHAPSPQEVGALEAVLAATNEVLRDLRTLNAYLHTFITTDARNDDAARLRSQLQARQATLDALTARLDGWVATLGAEQLAAASPLAADHAYPLHRAEASAQHRLSEGEEDLLAELSVTGSKAWARLHGEMTSRLQATVATPDGTTTRLPMAIVRALATHPDPRQRRSAFEGELIAWEEASVPLAAALNAIKGEANTLNRRRGWDDALEPALFANGVDRPTLEAMQEAARATFPDFRRYLRAKAALLGHHGGLPWWELFAPVGESGPSVDWETATAAVGNAFAGYSPALAALAHRAIDERWIDAEPRDGKVGGAFCVSMRDDESRVLLNFDGSWDGTQTLAHELGHAYHNTALAQRTPLQRQTPMALAETASIFCETLMGAAALNGTMGAERLARLDTDLTGACQVVVDIDSRFRFESRVFERRATGTLGVTELCDMMSEAQVETYGDGLASLHPYMWAVKTHYYSSAFYNWPYTFGLLFGIGLYAHYAEDPERFRAGYDDLLSATGLASAADLAGRFGIDVRSGDFWASSLDVIRGRIDEYVALSSR